MSDRRALLFRLAPLALVGLLAIAWVLPDIEGLSLAVPEEADTPASVEGVQATLDGLPEQALVVVGFDPDVGTYPEIRPTVRALLVDLLDRGGRLAFVTFTPEGRVLLLAELERLDRLEANPARLFDLGFVPGAEAALVELTRDLRVGPAGGSIARRLREGALEAADLAVVVGGNDFGPRPWVEQVLPRVDDLPLIAVAPTILLPEVLPYVETGQIDGLLGTPVAGATYRAGLDLDGLSRLTEAARPDLPLLIGMIAAFALLGQALGMRLVSGMRAGRARDGA